MVLINCVVYFEVQNEFFYAELYEGGWCMVCVCGVRFLAVNKKNANGIIHNIQNDKLNHQK